MIGAMVPAWRAIALAEEIEGQVQVMEEQVEEHDQSDKQKGVDEYASQSRRAWEWSKIRDVADRAEHLRRAAKITGATGWVLVDMASS